MCGTLWESIFFERERTAGLEQVKSLEMQAFPQAFPVMHCRDDHVKFFPKMTKSENLLARLAPNSCGRRLDGAVLLLSDAAVSTRLTWGENVGNITLFHRKLKKRRDSFFVVVRRKRVLVKKNVDNLGCSE